MTIQNLLQPIIFLSQRYNIFLQHIFLFNNYFSPTLAQTCNADGLYQKKNKSPNSHICMKFQVPEQQQNVHNKFENESVASRGKIFTNVQ